MVSLAGIMRLRNLIRDQIKGLWVSACRSGPECERGFQGDKCALGMGFAPRQKANTLGRKAQEGRVDLGLDDGVKTHGVNSCPYHCLCSVPVPPPMPEHPRADGEGHPGGMCHRPRGAEQRSCTDLGSARGSSRTEQGKVACPWRGTCSPSPRCRVSGPAIAPNQMLLQRAPCKQPRSSPIPVYGANGPPARPALSGAHVPPSEGSCHTAPTPGKGGRSMLTKG